MLPTSKSTSMHCHQPAVEALLIIILDVQDPKLSSGIEDSPVE